jgi:hypothetical protein
MMNGRTLFSLYASLLLCSAVAHAAAPPPPEAPLIHVTGSDRGCVLAFPAIPDRQVCINLGFSDTDLWVFRDSTALAVRAYGAAGFPPAQVPPTPTTTMIERGGLPAAQVAKLQAALAAVPIGFASGDCNPVPPLVGVPATFPQPDVHLHIVWWGKGFRSVVLELGSQFPDQCPQPLEELVSLLLNLPLSIVPSPTQD